MNFVGLLFHSLHAHLGVPTTASFLLAFSRNYIKKIGSRRPHLCSARKHFRLRRKTSDFRRERFSLTVFFLFRRNFSAKSCMGMCFRRGAGSDFRCNEADKPRRHFSPSRLAPPHRGSSIVNFPVFRTANAQSSPSMELQREKQSSRD